MRFETDKFQIQEKKLVDEVTVRTSELEHLERELELMNEAAEMALNKKHSVNTYIDQLNEQVQAKRNCLLTLESEWDTVRKPLEERKRSLEDSLYSNNPDALEMLQKLREVQQEEQFILSKIMKREAKKDSTGLQVYRTLVSIHKGFEQISEKILATDRIRREVAEYETKLASTASRSVDLLASFNGQGGIDVRVVTSESEENGEHVGDGKDNDDDNDIASDLTSNEVFF